MSVIFQSKRVGLFPFLILRPCLICCLGLSQMSHFNFSRESTQLLFWFVSDFVLCKAANFKSAFNLSHFQTTPPSRRKAPSPKIQCTHIHVCRVIKLLTIEFRDAAASSNDERMAMLAFSNSTWYSATEVWLILRNLLIFLVLSLEKNKNERLCNFGIMFRTKAI